MARKGTKLELVSVFQRVVLPDMERDGRRQPIPGNESVFNLFLSFLSLILILISRSMESWNPR